MRCFFVHVTIPLETCTDANLMNNLTLLTFFSFLLNKSLGVLHFGSAIVEASNRFCEKDYCFDIVPSETLLSLQEMHLQEAVW